jgi:hypothetical protein
MLDPVDADADADGDDAGEVAEVHTVGHERYHRDGQPRGLRAATRRRMLM